MSSNIIAMGLSIIMMCLIPLFLLLFSWVFAICWALGVPIKIKKKGKVTGYVKWFTYTPK